MKKKMSDSGTQPLMAHKKESNQNANQRGKQAEKESRCETRSEKKIRYLSFPPAKVNVAFSTHSLNAATETEAKHKLSMQRNIIEWNCRALFFSIHSRSRSHSLV